MKKKLLMIIGAGASIDFGMPSVKDIDEFFMQEAKNIIQLADVPSESLYSYIKKLLSDYYSRNSKETSRKDVNFEEILYVMFQLSNLVTDKLYYYPLNAFVEINQFPEIVTLGQKKQVEGDDFRYLVSKLVDGLITEFRNRCKNIQQERPNDFAVFKDFMEKLNDDFKVGCISLNYDNLIKQAIPNLQTGFDENSGEFNRSLIYKRMDWNFLYQIHGSVHFDMISDNTDMHSIKWNSNLAGHFQQNSIGRSSQQTLEGLELPTSVIVAGYAKTEQIQRDPFRTYYAELDRLIAEADAFIFIGYGFNDLHINKAFYKVREHSSRRPVLVIDWAKDNEDPLPFRNNKWARNLCETIPTNAKKMSFGKYSIPADIAKLKKNRDFEISTEPERPLAIWYGGFINACHNYDRIKNKL